MQHTVSTLSKPLALGKSTEAQVYLLFAVAIALTVVGVFAGMLFAPALLSSGLNIVFVLAMFAILLTARVWIERSPLNYVLFGVFPMVSGFVITPYIMFALLEYANGAAILLNALMATVFMAGAAAVWARTTPWDLSLMGRMLIFALFGLIGMGLLQLFIPSLRGTQMELLISGAGTVVFGLFTAYDIQRIQHLGARGANPFILALSLYLDIFNLFLYISRFMLAMSGQRR